MERIVELGNLFDVYGSLLTKRQQTIFSQYIDEDCSLAEISEREGISRQAVRDCISHCEEQLLKYEQILRIINRREILSTNLDRIEKLMDGSPDIDRKLLGSILEETREIL